ncbi:MAG: acylphosphatase [Chitinophagales bacterium]
MVHKRIRVSGKVQGVFYRASAKRKADELDLIGWVKNDDDGTISIYVAGEEEIVNEFIEWCKTGPPMAEVSKVDVEEAEEEKLNGFEQRRS